MKPFSPTLLAAAVAGVLALGNAQAQGSAGTGTGSAGTTASPGARAGASGTASKQVSDTDRTFVLNAAMAGMAEVEAGRVASQKATNPQVKEFAQKMVDDHTTGNSELMKLASARNIAPPEGPDKAHRAMLVKMEKMSGPEFDRAYMKQQVADHEKTVNLFERQSKNGKDPELRDFAAKQLPIMREHLKMAQMMQRGGDMSKGGMQHGGSTAGGSSSGGSAAGASAAGASATGGGMATGSASRSNPAPTGGAMGGTMGGNAGGPPGSGMTGTPGSPSGTAGGGMGGASGSGMGGGTGGSGAGGASGAGGGSR